MKHTTTESAAAMPDRWVHIYISQPSANPSQHCTRRHGTPCPRAYTPRHTSRYFTLIRARRPTPTSAVPSSLQYDDHDAVTYKKVLRAYIPIGCVQEAVRWGRADTAARNPSLWIEWNRVYHVRYLGNYSSEQFYNEVTTVRATIFPTPDCCSLNPADWHPGGAEQGTLL
jgi:hypothetical protein